MHDALGPATTIEELLLHAHWLRRLAAHLVIDPARADDLVQETWLAALTSPPRAGASPRRWLARVLRNLARNRRRDERTRGEHETRAVEPQRSSGPDSIAAEVEAQRVLADAVGRLADPSRTIVVLRYFRGLDSRAIGRELGLPAGTVRWKLKTALEELRRELDRRFEGGRRAWSLALARLLAAPATAPATGASAAWIAAAVAAVAVGWSVRELVPALGGASSAADPSSREARSELVAARPPLPPDPAADAGATSATARVPFVALALPRMAADARPDIAGSVLVDGAPPVRPVDFELVLAPPLGERAPPPRGLSTDAEGRFTVSAVSSGTAFTLRMRDHLLESEEGLRRESAPLETPALDLVLHLRTPPAVSGRAVDASGRAIAGADGVFLATARIGGWFIEAGPREIECDDAGRFEIPLLDLVAEALPTMRWAHDLMVPASSTSADVPRPRPEETCEGTLLFELARVGRAVRATGPFPFTDLDLGDIVLEPAHTLAFRVLDDSGAPLPGAVARLDDHFGSRPSNPTNRAGRGELRFMPERAARVRFSALGHADRVLELDPLDEPEVALAPVCLLEVQLAPAAGDFGPFPAIVLEADERPFVDSDAPRNALAPEPDPIQAELGAATCDWSSLRDGAGRRFRAWFEADAGGRVLISALRPGVAVVVEARVEGGPVLARRELVTSAGRHRIVLAYGESRQGD